MSLSVIELLIITQPFLNQISNPLQMYDFSDLRCDYLHRSLDAHQMVLFMALMY